MLLRQRGGCCRSPDAAGRREECCAVLEISVRGLWAQLETHAK